MHAPDTAQRRERIKKWPPVRKREILQVREDLPHAAFADLYRRMNPWWDDWSGRRIPAIQRRAFKTVLEQLDSKLAPVVVLRGPRQVGKSTVREQIIEHLIFDRGVSPQRIFRIQYDDMPSFGRYEDRIIDAVRWFEHNMLGKTLNQAERDGERVFLFLDEVQNFNSWAAETKHLVDFNDVSVMVTGSSSLRIKRRQGDLAGRGTTVTMGPLHLAEIAQFHGIELEPVAPSDCTFSMKKGDFWRDLRAYGQRHAPARDRAFALFSELGGYPFVHTSGEPWGSVAKQLKERVIERVIAHDFRGRWRNRYLLKAVLEIAFCYCGQAPSVREIARQASARSGKNVTEEQAYNHLQFLNDTLLLRLVEPLPLRLKKRKNADKICIADHNLRAALLNEKINLVRPDAVDADLAGRVAESIVGAYLANIPGVTLCHSPAQKESGKREIDYILDVGASYIPIEVKYRRVVRKKDTLGLLAHIENPYFRAPFGLLITQDDAFEPDDPRVIALPLSSFLLLR